MNQVVPQFGCTDEDTLQRLRNIRTIPESRQGVMCNPTRSKCGSTNAKLKGAETESNYGESARNTHCTADICDGWGECAPNTEQ